MDYISSNWPRVRLGVLHVCATAAVLGSVGARADGMPHEEIVAPAASASSAAAHAGPVSARSKLKVRARDPLAVDAGVAVRDTPAPEINLPGVLKLEGANRDVLDPSRARRISLTNGGSQTVYLSATDANRIQLPFVNPRCVSTTDIEIDKRATSNNVYVTFAAGVTRTVQLWIEPPSGSSVSVGLQLVPKHIPAQTVIVVDDAPAARGQVSANAGGNEYLGRVQLQLEEAALGQSPQGWSVVDLQVPLAAVNGLVVQGVRRLSDRKEDIYVYSVLNPGRTDATVQEREFNGDDVQAVSILPSPLLRPGQKAMVAVLARKHEAATVGGR